MNRWVQGVVRIAPKEPPRGGIHPPNLQKGALRGAKPLFLFYLPPLPDISGRGGQGAEVTMIALPPIDWYNIPYRDGTGANQGFGGHRMHSFD